MENGNEVRPVTMPDDIGTDELRARVDREWRDRWSHCLVALVDGMEAGVVLFDFYQETSDGSIQQVFVLSPFRRRGIASALIKYAEIELNRLGAVRIWLEPYALTRETGQPDATILRRWYSGLGFIGDDMSVRMTKGLSNNTRER